MFRVWVEEAILKYWLKVNSSLFEQEWHILTSIQRLPTVKMSSLFLFLFLPFPVLHDLTDWLQCWCWTRKPNICHFLVAILPSPPIAVAIYLLQLVAIILRLLHISCPLPSSTATNHILTALFYNMLKLEKNIKIWRIGSNMAATSTPSFCCYAKKRWETK